MSMTIPFDDFEIWKDVNGYEGLYQVSTFGRVKSLNFNHTGKEGIMRPSTKKYNYKSVELRKNGSREHFYVHRLVWVTFNGIIPKGQEVDHIDRHPENCRLSNLKCVSHLENMRNPLTREVHSKAVSSVLKERHKNDDFNKKIIEASVKACSKPVISYKDGEEKLYQSASEAFRITGVNFSHISACCRGKRKSAGGFIWRFAG